MRTPTTAERQAKPGGRPKRRYWVVLFGLVTVFAATGLVYRGLHPTVLEPIYEGRTVTAWLADPDSPAARSRAEMALLMTGTSAVPVLRHHLRAGTWVERYVWGELPVRLQALWNRPGERFARRLQVLHRVETLPDLARSLTPELVRVVADRTEPTETRIAAFRALVLTHPDSPSLQDLLGRVANEGGTLGGAAGRWLADTRSRQSERELKAYFATNALPGGPPTAAPLSEWRPRAMTLELTPVPANGFPREHP